MSVHLLKLLLAGHMWTDLSLATTNKGRGLTALQKKYDISPDETMVFGDYLNDYEMMKQAISATLWPMLTLI